jgi:mono/diheme cytochrome c family protein
MVFRWVASGPEFEQEQAIMIGRRISAFLLASGLVATCPAQEQAIGPPSGKTSPPQPVLKQFIEANCLDCHDQGTKQGGLALDSLLGSEIDRHAEAWEKVVRKLTARQMPPQDAPRPKEPEYNAAIAWLDKSLDGAAAAHPNPGRTETFRRLNRTEYQNTIRDLLALDVDVTSLLPADESSHGFDNITVTDLAPTLLNRYVSAAQKISRIAIGRAPRTPAGDTYRIRPDITQDTHLEGLPIGTRGGTSIAYNFPQNGEYEIQVRLMRDRNEGVESLNGSYELEVSLDRERAELLTIKPPGRGQSDQALDANLKTRVKVTAGTHKVGVTFLKKPSSLLETERQPLNVHFNFYRHPRLGPAVYEVSILGPFEASGPGQTPSRQRIFICQPTGPGDEEDCARRILANLARRAYRRAVADEDLKAPLELYRLGRAEGDFETGIETALSALLVNPQFLFRIERDPPQVPAGTAYRIEPVELASRLSYFLWSSMPDDELLSLATSGELRRPEVLEQQVRRMLADERSRSLIGNFAGQWLYLRNLEAFIPDMRLFPDFDDNLRQALRQETELFFESIVREDRSVLDLVKADYTYLNERLAKHYGIPHVYGSQFRRVAVDEASHRGGLLRQGSILAVTSYATRTSPVIRGKWILENILGTPPPPPPGNVPALKDNTVASNLSVRQRLAEHRANAACAGCHSLMDPVGFSLESYDAVGRWRTAEEGQPVDVTGGLPDGSEFTGVSGLERALLDRPELFVRTLTEKLLTFSLGRGIEYYDAPAVRRIVADAQGDNYRFSRLIMGIVQSTPFQMRKTP